MSYRIIYFLSLILNSVAGIAQNTILTSGGTSQSVNQKLSFSLGQVVYTNHSSPSAIIRQGVQQPRLKQFLQTPHTSPLSRYLGAAGGEAGDNQYNLSFTVGQPFYITKSSAGARLRDGIQQPLNPAVMINIQVFIEGLYQSGGLLASVLGPGVCDSVRIELHQPVAPFGLVTSIPLLLNNQGNARASLPGVFREAPYYLVIRHRNSVETWSKTPVVLKSINTIKLKSF